MYQENGKETSVDDIIVIYKWQSCERRMEMFNLTCKLDLEQGGFVLFHKRDEKCTRPIVTFTKVVELDAFLLGFETGKGV